LASLYINCFDGNFAISPVPSEANMQRPAPAGHTTRSLGLH